MIVSQSMAGMAYGLSISVSCRIAVRNFKQLFNQQVIFQNREENS